MNLDSDHSDVSAGIEHPKPIFQKLGVQIAILAGIIVGSAAVGALIFANANIEPEGLVSADSHASGSVEKPLIDLESLVPTPADEEVGAEDASIEAGATQSQRAGSQFAIAGAFIRAAPSASSRQIGSTSVRQTFSGQWVSANLGTDRWLQVNHSGETGYIWEGNLRPDLPLTRNWVAVGWVWSQSDPLSSRVPNECNTHGMVLNQSGEFFVGAHKGTFTVSDHRVILTSTHLDCGSARGEIGEPTGDCYVPIPPEIVRYRIYRYSQDRAVWTDPDGNDESMQRCL